MSPTPAIFALLQADAAVAALIGADGAMRAYQAAATAEARAPYVVYQRISTTPANHLATPAVAAQARMQLACWADGPADAAALSAAVQAALDHRRGVFGGVQVTAVARVSEAEDYEADTDLHVVRADYSIHYQEG